MHQVASNCHYPYLTRSVFLDSVTAKARPGIEGWSSCSKVTQRGREGRGLCINEAIKIVHDCWRASCFAERMKDYQALSQLRNKWQPHPTLHWSHCNYTNNHYPISSPSSVNFPLITIASFLQCHITSWILFQIPHSGIQWALKLTKPTEQLIMFKNINSVQILTTTT